MKRKNKRVSKPIFFIVAILIIVFSFGAFFGLDNYHGDVRKLYVKGVGDIRWGIDISGGVEAIFSPDIKTGEITKQNMDSAKEIIETRMINNNITDYEVYTDYDNHQLIVRFPWQSDDENYDPTAAIQELGETALLTFYKGQDNTGEIVLQGAADIKGADAGYTETNGFIVSLKLTDAGATKFAAATKEQLNNYISIYMDDTMISCPKVDTVITNGEAMITGMSNGDEATALANKINAGSLPFALTVDDSKLEVISPTFGEEALKVMLIAGVAAFAIICILMIFFYRLPGIIACIALLGQAAGMIACVSGFFPGTNSFTMTLPGIAGIILSIGFGVDANVITAERIKEEFRKGKTIDGAISQGYSNAFSSILDGNVTNVIVALVLLAAFGTPDSILARVLNFVFPFLSSSVTGNIYSFGYTLIVGVILNFIMGVWASRLMLMSISRFKIFRKPWLYGAPKNKTVQKFNFVGFRYKSIAIAAVVLVAGLVLTCVVGPKTDITFSGGSRFTYTYTGDISEEAVESALKSELGLDSTVTLNSDISGNSKKLVITVNGDINKEFNAEALENTLKDAASSKAALSSATESTVESTTGGTASGTASETTSGTSSSASSDTASSTTSDTPSSVTSSAEESVTNETMVDIKNGINHVLATKFTANTFAENNSNAVNPTLAGSFFIKALFAVLLAVLLVVVYIGIRFRKIGGVSAGVASLIALIHDVLIAFFACVIFGLAIDTNLIAVILALFGYSLNATIVMFDRVRENKKLYPDLSIREQVDRSINETVKRSVVTSITTFCAITAIAVVSEIFGVTALRSFTIPMAVGVIAGCFSSVFLAGPIWVKWCELRPAKSDKKK